MLKARPFWTFPRLPLTLIKLTKQHFRTELVLLQSEIAVFNNNDINSIISAEKRFINLYLNFLSVIKKIFLRRPRWQRSYWKAPTLLVVPRPCISKWMLESFALCSPLIASATINCWVELFWWSNGQGNRCVIWRPTQWLTWNGGTKQKALPGHGWCCH